MDSVHFRHFWCAFSAHPGMPKPEWILGTFGTFGGPFRHIRVGPFGTSGPFRHFWSLPHISPTLCTTLFFIVALFGLRFFPLHPAFFFPGTPETAHQATHKNWRSPPLTWWTFTAPDVPRCLFFPHITYFTPHHYPNTAQFIQLPR